MDEYHRLIEAGTLGEDDHVQLIAGAVVAMTPQGPAHALAIQNLTRLVAQGLAADLALRPQLPLTLPDDSEPEPDLAVVRLADARSREHHPRTALPGRRPVNRAGRLAAPRVATEAALYAGGADDPGYWIVNLAETAAVASPPMACGLTVVATRGRRARAPPLARGHEAHRPSARRSRHVASHARRDVA